MSFIGSADGFLERVCAVPVPVVAHFSGDRLQTGSVDGVNISVSDEFRKRFAGKVENNLPATRLVVYNLLRDFHDTGIVTGDVPSTVILLGHVWELVKLQPAGRDGVLFTGWGNVFHCVPDNQNLFCDVYIDFGGEDETWLLDASLIEDSREWLEGFQIFSREVS